ncbi:MAG: TolC family protein [Butyricicoccus sp.]
MKKQVISAALTAAITAGLCVPAQAASGPQAAGAVGSTAALLFAVCNAADTIAAPSAPPAQEVKSIGLVGLERTVRANNPTIKSLNKMVASVGSMSAASQDVSQIQGAVEGYEALIDALEGACKGLSEDDPLYIAYQEQIKILRSNVSSLNGTLDSLPVIAAMTNDAYREAEHSLRKQVDNVTNQLCSGAESMMIGIQTLEYTHTGLIRTLNALDRQLVVLKIQADRGMVSPLTYENAQTQRTKLAANIQMLETQQNSLCSSLALMCGYGANTLVQPSGMIEVTARDISKMKYETDLEEALGNSYTLWSKQDAVRSAANKKDNNLSGTTEAYEAAREDLAATEESLTSSFRQIYDDVAGKQGLVSAAETALEKAKSDLEISRVKYEIGTLSELGYKSAQDDLASAEDAVATAKINLLSAYQTYQWAKKGLISTGA